MTQIQISLNSVDKVKGFVNDIQRFDCDFDLVSGRYIIDAKSIMGIFILIFLNLLIYTYIVLMKQKINFLEAIQKYAA